MLRHVTVINKLSVASPGTRSYPGTLASLSQHGDGFGLTEPSNCVIWQPIKKVGQAPHPTLELTNLESDPSQSQFFNRLTSMPVGNSKTKRGRISKCGDNRDLTSPKWQSHVSCVDRSLLQKWQPKLGSGFGQKTSLAESACF